MSNYNHCENCKKCEREYYENTNALPSMPSEEDILIALRTLKQVCEANDCQCRECMLRNQDDNCGLLFLSDGDTVPDPTYWLILDKQNKRLLLH